jgi:hypothetical protein
VIDSLPDRPLSEDEAMSLLHQTNERFVPDAYIDDFDGMGFGYVTALYLDIEAEAIVLLGYDPDESGWRCIRTDDETTPITETYDRLDAWCEKLAAANISASPPPEHGQSTDEPRNER